MSDQVTITVPYQATCSTSGPGGGGLDLSKLTPLLIGGGILVAGLMVVSSIGGD